MMHTTLRSLTGAASLCVCSLALQAQTTTPGVDVVPGMPPVVDPGNL